MSPTESVEKANSQPELRLRLWPAVVITLATFSAVFLTTALVPGTMIQLMGMMMGPSVGVGLFGLWWLFASRRPSWIDRGLGVVVFVAAVLITNYFAHKSALIGLMSYGAPSALAAITLWFLFTSHWSWNRRRIGAAILTILAWGFWTAVRLDGVDGAFHAQLAWRWSPTREEQYLQSLSTKQSASAPSGTVEASAEEGPSTALTVSADDWPEFRGVKRDSRVEGVQLETDWSAHPPREIWRRPMGPAWSSFAVIGDHVYTQEQRGEQEVVLCLNGSTGSDEWVHPTETRFWESMAGAGPRATPTFHQGNIYALGATGRLHCLNAQTGAVVWSSDLTKDGEVSPPMWGFASSPLVVDQAVMVYAGGGPGRGILAYDRDSGKLLWKSGNGKHSYSSPQLVSIDSVPQVLMLTELGVFSVNPASGELLWEHEWPKPDMNRSIQPNFWNNRVLLGTGMGVGTRCVLPKLDGDKWNVKEEWTSQDLKPYYNDFVISDNHAYGFDGNIFACIDLANGERKWKRGRYGNGQVLLLADQKLLLVMAEGGDVVVLRADPEKHAEVHRIAALHGKTWNHPVVSHGRLYVRNAEEAACFELPTAH